MSVSVFVITDINAVYLMFEFLTPSMMCAELTVSAY